MKEVSIIGLDLAKNVFQAHGASADGSVVFRRKLSRGQLLKFFAEQSSRHRLHPDRNGVMPRSA